MTKEEALAAEVSNMGLAVNDLCVELADHVYCFPDLQKRMQNEKK